MCELTVKQLCLVVDDETGVRTFVAMVLRRAGFTVITAANASEGMSLVERQGADIRVIVTDVRMPEGVEGLEFARAVRRILPQIPIVVMSGYSDEQIIDFEFLNKPFTAQKLLETVNRVTKSA